MAQLERTPDADVTRSQCVWQRASPHRLLERRGGADRPQPLSSHEHSAIHVEHVAGNVGGSIRSEKLDRLRNIAIGSTAANRNRSQHRRAHLFVQNRSHGGLDVTRRDGIHGNSPRGHFTRQRARHSDQPGLRGRIVDLARLSGAAHHAGHIHNPAPAVLDHRAGAAPGSADRRRSN